MNYIKHLPLWLILGFLHACTPASLNKGASAQPAAERQCPGERTGDVWAFRSVLDGRIRMLSIGLHDSLWVAYSTQTGSFYKAWTEGLDFAGPVYGRGGGQPTSHGSTYLEEPEDNPWLIMRKGKVFVPEVQYKGHLMLDNRVTLKYELTFEDETIQLEEQPEYYSLPGGQVGLERTFRTTGVPDGAEVGLKVHLSPIRHIQNAAGQDYSSKE